MGNFTTNQLILANFTLATVLNPNAVNSFTAGYQYWNNLIDSTLRVPTFTFPGAVTFGTNTNVPQQSYQAKWQFRDDIPITHGKHAFRTGFDYLWEPKLGGFFEFNPTLEIDFLDLPSVILGNKTAYPEGFATPGAVGSMSATAGNPYFNLPGGSKMFGVYFQDDWKVSRNFTVLGEQVEPQPCCCAQIVWALKPPRLPHRCYGCSVDFTVASRLIRIVVSMERMCHPSQGAPERIAALRRRLDFGLPSEVRCRSCRLALW